MMYYINRAGIYGCLDPVEKLRPVSPIPIIIKVGAKAVQGQAYLPGSDEKE